MKLHLGCGKRNFGDEWVHVDGGDHPHLHSSDITSLPFEDNSAELIYASHVLEYFDREEAQEVLKEWHRVLVANGKLRLAVPDFEAMALLYCNQRSKGKDLPNSHPEKHFDLNKFLGPLYGKMRMGNSTIYHKTIYDMRSLTLLLEEKYFSKTQLYNWRNTEHSSIDDHSQAYLPHMNKENGILISLNVECRKNV
ncbi:MAG TPA: methyltransferase domain-containing protein [Flavobacteriales bacterium]|nr:methyltransferase domain-containing protein [Flavobacteriales bacterium]